MTSAGGGAAPLLLSPAPSADGLGLVVVELVFSFIDLKTLLLLASEAFSGPRHLGPAHFQFTHPGYYHNPKSPYLDC